MPQDIIMHAAWVEMQVTKQIIAYGLKIGIPEQKHAGPHQQSKESLPGLEQGDSTHTSETFVHGSTLFAACSGPGSGAPPVSVTSWAEGAGRCPIPSFRIASIFVFENSLMSLII